MLQQQHILTTVDFIFSPPTNYNISQNASFSRHLLRWTKYIIMNSAYISHISLLRQDVLFFMLFYTYFFFAGDITFTSQLVREQSSHKTTIYFLSSSEYFAAGWKKPTGLLFNLVFTSFPQTKVFLLLSLQKY